MGRRPADRACPGGEANGYGAGHNENGKYINDGGPGVAGVHSVPGAGPDGMHQRRGPGQVGKPVNCFPGATAETLTQEAGDDQGRHNVERNRPDADPQRVVPGEPGDNRRQYWGC